MKKNAQRIESPSENDTEAAEIGIRLKVERQNVPKITQAEAAKLSGSSLRAWSDYEAGNRTIPLEVLSRFAKARNRDIFFLLTGREYALNEEPLEVDVPIYSEVKAGQLTFHFPDENIIGYVRTNIKDVGVYALVVRGESMAPEIQDGDVIIVNPTKPFLSGRLYIVVVDDETATIKRVFRRNGSYELTPTNQAFETKVIPEENILRCDRVVEVRRGV